jgi:hypothetical protein
MSYIDHRRNSQNREPAAKPANRASSDRTSPSGASVSLTDAGEGPDGSHTSSAFNVHALHVLFCSGKARLACWQASEVSQVCLRCALDRELPGTEKWTGHDLPGHLRTCCLANFAVRQWEVQQPGQENFSASHAQPGESCQATKPLSSACLFFLLPCLAAHSRIKLYCSSTDRHGLAQGLRARLAHARPRVQSDRPPAGKPTRNSSPGGQFKSHSFNNGESLLSAGSNKLQAPASPARTGPAARAGLRSGIDLGASLTRRSAALQFRASAGLSGELTAPLPQDAP